MSTNQTTTKKTNQNNTEIILIFLGGRKWVVRHNDIDKTEVKDFIEAKKLRDSIIKKLN